MEPEPEIIAAEEALIKLRLQKANAEQRRHILRILSGSDTSLHEEPRKTEKKPRKGTGTGAFGGPFLKESCKMGTAPIQVHRERLRSMQARLPFSDEEADRLIERAFRKSTISYRRFADGSWGFRKPLPLELVG